MHMKLKKYEIQLAKLIAFILIILTLLEINAFTASGATRKSIANLFIRYNSKLTREQALLFSKTVFQASAKYHVSPALIAAIIVCESSARPRVVSKTGDYGLMQIHYKAHKDKVSKRSDLFNPRINIFLGTRIFAQYRKGRTLHGALTRYSGGNKSYARKVIRTLRNIERRQ